MKRMKLAVIIGSFVAFATLGEAAAAEAIPVVQQERVVQVTAKVSEYSPHEILLKKGEPVILELTSQDREHGFRLPDFGVRADIKPGQVTRVRLLPQQVGRFSFACDVFCGVDHEEMVGEIVVVE
jgi:cytochrome c oxidase subunit II